MTCLSTALSREDRFIDWPYQGESELIVLDSLDSGEALFDYELGASTCGAETIPIENFLIYYYAWGAKIRNPDKVRDYLLHYPEIAELARFVFESVYRSFDHKTQLILELQDDDIPNSDYLAAMIRVPEYDNEFVDQMRTIREKYYDFLNKANGWFLLTTDFCPLE